MKVALNQGRGATFCEDYSIETSASNSDDCVTKPLRPVPCQVISRYKASSCSRLRAINVAVTARYVLPLLMRLVIAQ